MTRVSQRAALLLGLGLATAGVHAEVADIQWTGDGASQHDFHVAAGKFAEWCGKLPRGTKVQWAFEASAPLNFNVHFHEGKDVRFPAKQDGTAKADGSLDVAVDQDYCWMWTNKSTAAVTVKASLRKAP